MEAVRESLIRDGVVQLPDLYLIEPPNPAGKRKKSHPYKEKVVVEAQEHIEHFRPLIPFKAKRTEAELITTRPLEGQEVGSQLWHRDGHAEPGCIRVFIYLTDVDMNNGPFCYAPGDLPPMAPMSEEEFEQFVPRSEWLTFTGPRGTVIVADILGYHRGLKNLSGERRMLCLSYYA